MLNSVHIELFNLQINVKLIFEIKLDQLRPMLEFDPRKGGA